MAAREAEAMVSRANVQRVTLARSGKTVITNDGGPIGCSAEPCLMGWTQELKMNDFR
jgi:hypothetical protein